MLDVRLRKKYLHGGVFRSVAGGWTFKAETKLELCGGSLWFS